ncbi:MAG TPA: hypothetical protein VIR63_00825 [Pontiella sp.]
MKNEFIVLPKWVTNLALWIGLTAGISVRLLMILNRWHPEAAVIVWRFAMANYSVFFLYRFFIARRRRSIVVRHQLIAKIRAAEELDEITREGTLYILRSIVRSKELFNYAFIFILSLLALAIDFCL